MLVIEGADHLGKTTLCHEVVKLAAEDGQYPIRYQHMTRPNKAFDFQLDYLDMISDHAVQDRFHLGAKVYHPEGTLTDYALSSVQIWLKNVSSLTVIVYSSSENWYSRFLKEHPKAEMFTHEFLLGVNRKYEALALTPGMCDVSYDVSENGFPSSGGFGRRILSAWIERLNANPNTRRKAI